MADNLAMKPRTRVTWTPAERAEWLVLFEKSGRTAAEFCRDNDLSPATLSFWLRQQQAPDTGEEAALVEVPMPALSALTCSSVAVKMQLPSGIHLEILAGTDLAWLAQLLRALQPARA
jgi:transposase-like protein